MELTQNGRDRLIASIATSVVVLSSVFLRFWCKLLIKDGIHLDDWVMLSTVPIYVIAYASIIWGIFNGGKGRPMSELVAAATLDPSPENTSVVETYFKSLFVCMCTSPWGLAAIKISLCLWYQRIFVTESFRRKSTAVIAISVACLITSFIVDLCICTPISRFWDPLQPGRCINGNLFFLLICIGETLLDITVMVLPVRAISFVQIPLKTKLIVACIFLLGGFAVITDLLRIYYTYTSGIETNEALFWGEVHTATAVLCGNLPVYQPIRARIGNGLSVIKSAFESAFSRLQNERRKRATAETRGDAGTCAIGGRKSISADSLNMRLNPNARQHIVIAWGSDSSHDDMELPSRGIVHTRNFEVV
ncbi:hypothetical protein PG990_001799 [Apiospora arundinis]